MSLYRDHGIVLRTYKLGEADRIIVFSARPARVLRNVDVAAELPRDRTMDIVETPAFRKLRREVLALIRHEELRTEAAEAAAAS